MHTQITARHSSLPEDLRERAERVLQRLASHASRPVDATVTFDNHSVKCSVELRLHLSSGETLVASAEAADHRSALDRAEQKLRRQLEKGPRAHRSRRAGAEPQ
jgi:ribosome hibernation promoting factor